MQNTVIIGAGQAGYSVASQLRKEDYSGSITLLGDEPQLPYQRPPLSKKYLLGQMDSARLALRKAGFYEEHSINLITGCTVSTVDTEKQLVQSSSGEFHYDQLVFATGSQAKALPEKLGGNHERVFTLRNIADIDLIRNVINEIGHLAIIGGGYIGLEAAAVFSSLGKQVTVIEAADRILQRVACEETSRYFRELHQLNGVEIRESSALAEIQPTATASKSLMVRLNDDTRIAADAALIGIGADPAVSLAKSCGLTLDSDTGGIRVDSHGLTSKSNIWATGDCASFEFRGRQIRLESVQNAIDQSEIVASNIAGQKRAYEPVPWFWSDQYKTKLQIAGLNQGYKRVVQRQGAKPGSMSNWYYDDIVVTGPDGDHPRLLAVDAINDAMAYMTARKLLEKGLSIDPMVVADTQIDLKAILSANKT